MHVGVEVEKGATPATRLNLNHLTRNISRNTGATRCNNQSRSVHIQDKYPYSEYPGEFRRATKFFAWDTGYGPDGQKAAVGA